MYKWSAPFSSLKFLRNNLERVIDRVVWASGAKETTWHCTSKQLSQINTKINCTISNNTYNVYTKTYPEIPGTSTGNTFICTVYYMQIVTQTVHIIYILSCAACVPLQKWTNIFWVLQNNSHRPTFIFLVKQNRSLHIIHIAIYKMSGNLESSHAGKDKVDSGYTTVAFPRYIDHWQLV